MIFIRPNSNLKIFQYWQAYCSFYLHQLTGIVHDQKTTLLGLRRPIVLHWVIWNTSMLKRYRNYQLL